MQGKPFGRYRLVELLGRGGMGEVWRAHDTETDRIVAVKVLPAHLSGDKEFQLRFRREAQAAARLNNPHIIPIHHYGEVDGQLYVDMRLVEGRDLHAVLADGPLDPSRAVRIIEQVAKALHAAHEVGLLHRDIKPSNILLDRDDFAYLIDFGLARGIEDTRMTKSGNTIGTFQYIAPERLDPRTEEDGRADIYSLACVLYESLTGKPPFPGSTAVHLMYAHANNPPPRPSDVQPNLPSEIDQVIATGMAKDRDRRYATTIELAEAAHAAIIVAVTRAAPTPIHTQLGPSHSTPPAFADETQRAQPQRMQRPSRPLWRRKRLLFPAGAIILVAAIGATISIAAFTNYGPPQSSSTPSPRPFGPQAVLPFSGLSGPVSVAVDSTGAIYVTDLRGNHRRVLKLAAASSTATELPFIGLDFPSGIAIDSTGTVYVTDTSNSRVLKLAASSSTPQVVPFTGLLSPQGVAVDSTGTLYVTDNGNNQVLKLAASSSTPQVVPFTGLKQPQSVAVDSTGTLYVTDIRNHRVLELAAGASTQQVLPFTGLSVPHGVAVDSTGAVYVTDGGNDQVLKLAAGASTQVLPFTGLSVPQGVAVDSTGAVYVADLENNRVLKLPAQ